MLSASRWVFLLAMCLPDSKAIINEEVKIIKYPDKQQEPRLENSEGFASDLRSASVQDQVRALETRSQHYWECALPSLQRLEKNKNISGVDDTLFRSVESLKIANLYFKIKDYESAKTYAQHFLTVKPNDAAGHEMLGQCHEGLENKIKAFEEFKVSLSLNLNNKNVLKKLATLAIDNDVPLDLVKDKYWIERIEQHLATQPAERFKLKEKLVKMSQGNENYSKQYEELLKAELEANPQSLDVHLKLLRLYKTSGRIMGAYVLTMNKTKKKWTQEYVWYNEIVDICQQYEAYQAKANLWGDEGKTKFYENYLHNIEKEIKFAFQRKGKEVADLEKSLSLFDEVLYKYRSSVPNFDQSASLSEKLVMQHYSAQLCFYSLLLLLKKTQPVNHLGSVLDHALVSNPDSFKEKLSGCVPPILLALNPGLVLEFDPKSHGTSGPDNIDEMKAETNYRISQCSLFLGMLKKYGFVYGSMKDLKQ
ncbi:uncharacterized protein LOC113467975 [Diaphorina citri]|uniref:Uncharacterized protein LOC113467975 n=1 Tax=Diaphorina citri TaxID=121845 RepID=A0A3Q0J0U0_DIACI|nr:uncharacterized protein LOC113467975 [Diaphorina citri]